MAKKKKKQKKKVCDTYSISHNRGKCSNKEDSKLCKQGGVKTMTFLVTGCFLKSHSASVAFKHFCIFTC